MQLGNLDAKLAQLSIGNRAPGPLIPGAYATAYWNFRYKAHGVGKRQLIERHQKFHHFYSHLHGINPGWLVPKRQTLSTLPSNDTTDRRLSLVPLSPVSINP